ncbi:MAG TPA: hypothetical protein VGK14_07120 [Novimethylophilus sp.]|jgi:hypothetical protein|uniref:hypothetical protein n=1 Tax=Novimethylophilus sp. TaxID=2137426 RepID=UPI002F42031A
MTRAPLSTSSFERQLPGVSWIPILGAALLIFAVFMSFMEIRLVTLGYHPTILDSQASWMKERARASRLGERALILIGASRIQLGIDLDVLREKTGLEPVQLAIDGSASTPILEGLAADQTIRGTILVDYYDHNVGSHDGAAPTFQKNYEKNKHARVALPLGRTSENSLSQMLHESFRVYADGANPLFTLLTRIIPAERSRQYLVTYLDRSRTADYSLVKLPEFYHQRVIRNLGLEKSLSPASKNLNTILPQEINKLMPLDNRDFMLKTQATKQLVEAIKARGGQVIFVAMPSSGMVRDIEERRYPRSRFWDYFTENIGVPAVHSAYSPALKDFTCPDGSHLDVKDRARFTGVLADVLEPILQKQAPNKDYAASRR